VRPPTAQEAVLRELRDAIISGAIAPGTQLLQEEVAEQFGVRTTRVLGDLTRRIAHVYAAALEHSIENDQRMRWHEVTEIAWEERSIVLSGVVPGTMLVLGGIELWKASTAVWLALGAGLVVLAAQGLRYSRVERLGFRGTVVAVGVNLGLGLVIVALKAALTH
jgi:hypothetical protein